MKNDPSFDPLFQHSLAKVKPIASGGLKNRYPRPKIHGYYLFLGLNRENEKYPIFDPLFYHFLVELKPIASGGIENSNPRPKIHEYFLFLGLNQENEK